MLVNPLPMRGNMGRAGAGIVHPRQIEVKSPFSDYTCLEAYVAGCQIVTAIAGVLR